MFNFNHQRSKNYEEVFVLALYDSLFFFFSAACKITISALFVVEMRADS